MPTNDPEYMKNYQRKRRAKIAGEEPLGKFIADHLDNEGIEAVLEGIRKGTPDAWRKYVKGRSMTEPVKKAIEPDEVKVTDDGKLTKGLGPLPGHGPATRVTDYSGTFRPAPKPESKPRSKT